MPKNDIYKQAGQSVIKLKQLLAQLELQKYSENKRIGSLLKGGVIK